MKKRKVIKVSFLIILIFAWVFSAWSSLRNGVFYPSGIREVRAESPEVFDLSNTWIVPPDVCEVTVEIWGAGGGGGNGASNNAGAGGGGGSYSSSVFNVLPDEEYTVTVGTGGSATQSGGDSWFNSSSTVMAKGGGGGGTGTSIGLGGSSASGFGSVKRSGGNGGAGGTTGRPADRVGGGGGGSATASADGGNGADGGIGTGGGGGTGEGNGGNGVSGAGTGGTGNAPGGGGGGGGDTGTGGAGANGRVVLTYAEDLGCADPNVHINVTGSQVSEADIPSTDKYIGGAFTFIQTKSGLGSINVTQVIITATGTVDADVDVSNLKLHYKEEATCSTSLPGDATEFNSTGVGFSSSRATTSGSMTIGTNQTCVYLTLNVGSGATDGETLLIQITSSSDVTVSDGTVSLESTPLDISGTTTLKDVQPTVSCSVSATSTEFGEITATSIYSSSPSITVTTSCEETSSGCEVSVQGEGSGTNPGLWSETAGYLISSANATLSAGTEGYGIQATTTASGSGETLVINSKYNLSGDEVGGLSRSANSLASSTGNYLNREIVITYKVSISSTTLAGNYEDTITYSCIAN